MSLNQVLEAIKAYFKAHPLISQVNITIDDDSFNALTGLTYPVVNLQYVDSDAVADRFQHNFKVIIADLTNPNVEGIDFEIYSDSLQIAGDFFHWLEDNYSFDAIRTTNFQPFTDSNVDRITGVVFNLGIFTWLNKNIECP